MQRIAGVIFFLAWLLCGCSMEKVFDDWRACLVVVIALVVCVVTAALITGGDD